MACHIKIIMWAEDFREWGPKGDTWVHKEKSKSDLDKIVDLHSSVNFIRVINQGAWSGRCMKQAGKRRMLRAGFW